MFSHDLVGWRTQYDRMIRGAERLRGSYQSSVEHQDDLYHFIQDCWHFKDWIHKDEKLPANIRAELLERAERDTILRTIRDLALSIKHLRRTSNPNGAYAVSQNVTAQLGQPAQPAVIEYTIVLEDGSKMTDSQLVEQAITAWNRILPVGWTS